MYHHYDVGDTYPRQGLSPDEARIEELSGSANAQGTPLIVEAKEKVDAEKA